MADEIGTECDQPHPRPRRIKIRRRSTGIRDEATPKDASGGFLPTGDEERPTTSLKTDEQEAVASREQGLGEPQNELHEIERAGQALQTSTPRRLSGDSGLESPRPHVCDSQSTGPEEANNPQSNGERNEADSPDATVPGVRWISQEDLEKLIPQGVDLFQSRRTDAIYHLNHRGERVWVVDKNGDCVIAQTPPEGADG
ncbi:hypothetical protein KVR01_002040 [Diaporthe batatas]|uniref:uncharacterized protein n=1 Tax=Diaporthe batatas TaxID=748121 RepID=UPI001D0573B7|nr:uncharacterized protein KVR01_002040 [Diaporthe batatas]KAG8166351.1 hypothetical protein KVR01_002040 [Diaporthe batatas]